MKDKYLAFKLFDVLEVEQCDRKDGIRVCWKLHPAPCFVNYIAELKDSVDKWQLKEVYRLHYGKSIMGVDSGYVFRIDDKYYFQRKLNLDKIDLSLYEIDINDEKQVKKYHLKKFITDNYVVYVFFRKDNGEPCYIGSGTEDRPTSGDRNDLCNLISEWCGVEVEVVADGLTKAEAMQIEKELIKEFSIKYPFSMTNKQHSSRREVIPVMISVCGRFYSKTLGTHPYSVGNWELNGNHFASRFFWDKDEKVKFNLQLITEEELKKIDGIAEIQKVDIKVKYMEAAVKFDPKLNLGVFCNNGRFYYGFCHEDFESFNRNDNFISIGKVRDLSKTIVEIVARCIRKHDDHQEKLLNEIARHLTGSGHQSYVWDKIEFLYRECMSFFHKAIYNNQK